MPSMGHVVFNRELSLYVLKTTLLSIFACADCEVEKQPQGQQWLIVCMLEGQTETESELTYAHDGDTAVNPSFFHDSIQYRLRAVSYGLDLGVPRMSSKNLGSRSL